MLQMILSDDSIIFIAIHAFLLGIVIGVAVSNHGKKALKKQLRNLAEAYDHGIDKNFV
ncbi:MAG: hypothetical protein ACOVP6_03280 [Lacibacter sp.]